MKKTLLILLILKVSLLQSQTPKIMNSDFVYLTPIVNLNNDYNIGLLKNGINLFVILERKLSEKERFLKVDDKTLFVNYILEMKIYSGIIKRGTRSYMGEMDIVTLNALNPQPEISTKNEAIIFSLPDKLAFDLKNQYMSTIQIINEGSSITTSVKNKSFFVTYSSKITSSQGSFYNISKYKKNNIPLYSLLRKNQNFISSKIGMFKFCKKFDAGYMLGYETEDAYYSVSFTDSLSVEIKLFPKQNIKYIGEEFIFNRYPFEIVNCNCGDYVTEDNSATDRAGINNTFKDGTVHHLYIFREGRIVEYVLAECDDCQKINGRYYIESEANRPMNSWWKIK